VTPSASAGNLAIVDCIVTALGGNGITITGASTTLTLLNSQVLVQAGNGVAPISVAGIYSIINTIYDKPGSTLTGTSTNSIDYFQYINADKFITQGGTSNQFVKGDGSLDSTGPISGTSGTSGSSGSSGINGNDGTSGSSGISGTNGVAGSSGSSGSSGTSGTSPTGSTRYYGAFYSDVTQSLLAADTPQVMSANTTTLSSGVVLSGGTKFVVQHSGVYNLQFSAQLYKTSSGTDEVAIWFRKNGFDIAESNTEIQVAKQGAFGKLVAAWNYVDQLNANDYLEIVWASADTTYALLAEPVQISPYAKPATPSIIVTVTQV
jgi:hypothetical protein